jgi:hygromycin-B 7''-O-kinase
VLLPRITSLDEYRAVYAVPETWLPAMREIATRHGLPGPAVQQPLGTHVVFGFGDRGGGPIVKLFCPLWPADYQSEQISLAHQRGLPVPRLLAQGEIEGWPYLILSRVEGVPAVEVWPALGPEEKLRVVRQMGAFMRRLHQQPLPTGLPADWPTFLAERLARAEAHHDAPEPWRKWIRERIETFVEPPFDPVLLNGDLTGDHVLLVRRRGAWQMSGVIDFGDARIGHPFYEFIAPLAFYTFGQPALSRALVEAYSLEPSPALLDALTTYCLLHEFGRLSDFLAQHPAGSPAQFETALWGE